MTEYATVNEAYMAGFRNGFKAGEEAALLKQASSIGASLEGLRLGAAGEPRPKRPRAKIKDEERRT